MIDKERRNTNKKAERVQFAIDLEEKIPDPTTKDNTVDQPISVSIPASSLKTPDALAHRTPEPVIEQESSKESSLFGQRALSLPL